MGVALARQDRVTKVQEPLHFAYDEVRPTAARRGVFWRILLMALPLLCGCSKRGEPGSPPPAEEGTADSQFRVSASSLRSHRWYSGMAD